MSLPERDGFTRRVLDNLYAFVAVLDLDGTLIAVNRAPLEVSEVTTEDVIGRKFWDCYWWSYSPEVQARLRESIERARSGEIVRYDVVVRTSETGRMLIDFQLAPLRDEEGEITHLIPSAMDITERVRTEEALRESEERFRQLADSMPQLVWTADSAGVVDYYNSRVREYSGIVQRENGAWSWAAVVHPDDLETTVRSWHDAIETESPYQVEHRIQMAAGPYRWHLSRAFPVRQSGGVLKWYGTATDIDDYKRAGEAVRESERLVSTIAENSTQGLALMDERGYCTYANRAWLEMTGYTREDMRTKPLHDLVHHHYPDGRLYPREECPIDRALPNMSEIRNHHDLFFRKDGTPFPIVCAASPIHREGKPVGTVIEIADMTEARRAEATIQRQARLIHVSHEPILAWTVDDGIVEWNAGAERLYGYTRDEALGRSPHELLHTVHPVPLDEIMTALRSEGEWKGELRHTAKDGSQVIVESRHQKVEIDGQRMVLESNRDITERKRQQLEIGALNARLRRSMRETHHRVKNNLQVISALAELHPDESVHSSPAMRRISQHARALASLHDVLTQEAILNPGIEDVSAREALGKLMALLQTAAGRRRILFTCDDIRVPVRECGSLALLTSELVSNAVKHGDGDIEVRFTREGSHAQLVVCDGGVGFPPEFDPVRDANTGLDLIATLARHDLQGALEFTNLDGRGACVTATFPLEWRRADAG